MKYRVHSALTIVATIKPGQADKLRMLLQDLARPGSSFMQALEFMEYTLNVSGVVLPAQCYQDEILPETFVFATTYSGWRSNHLTELVSACRADLCSLFENCIDFPAPRVTNPILISYIKRHMRKGAFNSRYSPITREDVEREKELRKEIENYVDDAQAQGAFTGRSAKEVQSLIQRHVLIKGQQLEWCYRPDTKSVLEYAVLNRAPIIVVVFLALLANYLKPNLRKNSLRVVGWSSGSALLLYLTLLYISSAKTATALRQSDDKVRQLAATQLYPVINGMTATGALKSGRLRRHVYSFGLRLINVFAPYVMKIPTVSSIRWLAINNKKRLLFMSNYSNSTDFYVREFLSGGSLLSIIGINFMFTNGEGFPDAYLLALKGAIEDPEGYMNAVHYGQQVNDLWYVHEPLLTSDTINKNRRLRNGLFKHMTEQQAKEWLKLI
jgi:hypothetical protein